MPSDPLSIPSTPAAAPPASAGARSAEAAPARADRARGGLAYAEMNPRQLWHFETLAQMGSGTAAARYLGISPSALAQSIARLEGELGLDLFDRSTRPARLTEAGQLLLDYVARFAAETEALQERFAQERGEQSGILRIGCGPRWMVDIIPRAVEAFLRLYPGMRVAIVADQMTRLAQRLEDRQIALMFGTIDMVRHYTHHEVIEMKADRFTIVARSSHPLHGRGALSLAELARERWIFSDPASSSSVALRELLRRTGLAPIVPTVELSDTLAVAAMLRRTDLLAIVSASTVRTLDEIEALPIDFQLPESRSGVIRLRDRSLSAAESAFIDEVQRTFL
ncbi:LysR family transcriptional regulator [Cereibacter johrii]